ncbi:dTDP-4-dehydrorhamnose 3,5-epimerase [Pseudomonas sp. FSL R10-0399]|uniref:dTDP-4-dehydrorhamnose 3,5-epimerase n=1 Tax=Pseudomonas sp. FSL R10-0399 TaxID=2662194 RepID=UPI0012961D63|nr:dTDP-4-dehydrorhamnose 3,5-epimerase [Pseudomonas sp. FSL R10-0399]MQT59111.1 dTDP-4-dehydrorhamnose 3,5-epimerase [Pseudomonas sp. FSL R10-0399]
MKIIRTDIPDVLIIEPTVFTDDRGWFMESFNEKVFANKLEALGLPAAGSFVQDNHSCSRRGVLRGMHFQAQPYAQGKLVRVAAGAAFDVAVDIRKDSPTYLKWVGVELSGENNKMLWIPKGFAHGFLTLEDNTHFLYKTTNYYNKESEGSLLWSDESIGITWPVMDAYIINEKDKQAPKVFDV